MVGLSHALAALGVEPSRAVRTLLELGLLAARIDRRASRSATTPACSTRASRATPSCSRTRPPSPRRGPSCPRAIGLRPSGPVRHVREADGLEPILRLAARLAAGRGGAAPPDAAGDALQARPRAAGGRPGPGRADRRRPRAAARHGRALARPGAGGRACSSPSPRADRIVAARPEFWAENAIHLPQMIADPLARLARRGTSRAGCAGGEHGRAGPPLSPAGDPALARRARPRPTGWRSTTWPSTCAGSRPTGSVPRSWGARRRLAASTPARAGRPAARARPGRPRRRPTSPSSGRSCSAPPTSSAWSARPRRTPGGRRVVQLTPLGRYILALGPPPPPRPTLRALPVRPAELRDHRLSAGPDPDADRPVQPVRAVDADRRGAGAEADARVDLSGARRRPDARRRSSIA